MRLGCTLEITYRKIPRAHQGCKGGRSMEITLELIEEGEHGEVLISKHGYARLKERNDCR